MRALQRLGSTSFAAALLPVLLAVGCTEPGGGRGLSANTTGGKGDNLGDSGGGEDVPLSDHRGAVGSCEAVAEHLREHLGGGRTDALVDLERDRNDCLVSANDLATERVSQILGEAMDPYAGEITRGWKSHRTAATGACNVLVEAHPDATGDGLAAVAAACIAGVEHDFADILDAYVDFGVAPFPIPGARDRYTACYDDYDAALEAAAGETDEVVANEALAGCIANVHDGVVGELAARVAASFGKDAAATETAIRDALSAFSDAREKICVIATRSGPGRGTTAMDLHTAECLVDSAIQGGALLDLAAPGVLPGEGSSSGSDGGESSGDAGSSSSDGGGDSSTSF
ncbi:MAG: hypothetical protein K1X88_00080 [Nannocystaceae bacterium]|nr:hypothetical protein [Nannocystaceae bacterium]